MKSHNQAFELTAPAFGFSSVQQQTAVPQGVFRPQPQPE